MTYCETDVRPESNVTQTTPAPRERRRVLRDGQVPGYVDIEVETENREANRHYTAGFSIGFAAGLVLGLGASAILYVIVVHLPG